MFYPQANIYPSLQEKKVQNIHENKFKMKNVMLMATNILWVYIKIIKMPSVPMSPCAITTLLAIATKAPYYTMHFYDENNGTVVKSEGKTKYIAYWA